MPSNCARVRSLAGEAGGGLPVHTKRAAISHFASRVCCDSSLLIHWELSVGGGGETRKMRERRKNNLRSQTGRTKSRKLAAALAPPSVPSSSVHALADAEYVTRSLILAAKEKTPHKQMNANRQSGTSVCFNGPASNRHSSPLCVDGFEVLYIPDNYCRYSQTCE